MNLADLKAGASVLIDTNILLYARRGSSRQCQDLLKRCHRLEIRGIITSFIVAEFCHRRMMQEVQGKGLVSANPAKSLSEKPAIISGLSIYADDTRALLSGDLDLISPEHEDFSKALFLQATHGLLTIDSLNLAVAQRLRLDGLVSADLNFSRVEGLVVYSPTDISVS